MTVETTEPSETKEALAGDHTQREERSIETGDVVALGREVDVPIGVLPTERGRVQLLEEQVDEDVECTEARPEMP
jgi:hypothetical protein